MAILARAGGAGALPPAVAGLAALWLAAGAAFAQEMRVDTWAIEEGLPQNSVTDIIQTPDGYLWLATFGGLVRFDGHRFTVFDRSVEGIGSVRTRALHVDRTGALWAGTDDGAILRYREGRFTTFTSDDGLEGRAVLRIDEDDRGHIWFTWETTLTRFDGERFDTVRPGDLSNGVRSHLVGHSSYAPSALWWNAEADGVYCLLAGRVIRCLDAEEWPPGEIIWASSDRSGHLWFHLRDGRAIRKAGEQLEVFGPQDGMPRANAGSRQHQDRTKTLWVIEFPGGLQRIRNGRASLLPIAYPICVFEDREGAIWVGSASGLHRVRDAIVSTITMENGLSSDNVYSILRDRPGNVWVGTWGGGLTRLTNGQGFAYAAGDGLPSPEVSAILEDSTGRLLVATTRGLTHMDGNRLHPYEDPHGWLTSVAAIQEDASGFWFGTAEGLVRQTGGRFERFTAADGLRDSRVTTLFKDRSDHLWIGTLRGLTVLRNGVFSTFSTQDGFDGSHVRAFFEDASGVLWIGTYDAGLYRLEGDRFTRYTTQNGLFDNGVFQILDDGHGYFWFGSNRGIFRVSQAELDAVAAGQLRSVRSVAFDTRDGMVSAECNGGRQPAGARMPDGTLWFPTQGGIAIVDPTAVAKHPHAPPVLIENVRLSGEPTPFAAGIEIPPDRNSLEVQFTAMAFLRPEQTRFRYRLVGLDDAWIEAGVQRAATYYRIPPGRYRFEVTAANGDGVWNPAGASMAVVVHAPLWRRGWFLMMTGLVAAVGTALAIRRRFERLRRDHARQQAFARQLLETQEQERRRISNELHDSLGQDLFMIRARARMSRQDTSDAAAREALDTIESLVGESYEDMKRIARDLRPYHLDKIGLSKTIAGMLTRVGETCDLTVNLEIADVDASFAPSAAINVFRIVQEAVQNVVRHSGAATASVRIARVGSAVEIVIADDGRGFDPAAAAAGFGLMNMRERALALGGLMIVGSSPGDGTRVHVTLPVEEPAHG